MNFSQALDWMKNGAKVARTGWNGKNMWVAHQPAVGTLDGKNYIPFLYMRTVDGSFVPWLISMTDVLAEDWNVVAAAESSDGRNQRRT